MPAESEIVPRRIFRSTNCLETESSSNGSISLMRKFKVVQELAVFGLSLIIIPAKSPFVKKEYLRNRANILVRK
ncbi:hypothetical protein CEH05_03925 [Halobacillus halophilus]|nr:hypothetical protein CEH05_03925 [Halobacillus halophilus]